ncbi:MAG: hypothetical protein DRQ55_09700 [Planctomycetota bacterium]|nr:MAG: hypothetical protein DRQ55_09700 [Planctomycetota bacterium]
MSAGGASEEASMYLPVSTGQAAALLGVTEPRLNDLVRRGRIHPAPAIHAGRRLWEREHLIQAAEDLNLQQATLDAALAAAEVRS